MPKAIASTSAMMLTVFSNKSVMLFPVLTHRSQCLRQKITAKGSRQKIIYTP
jgi:hypothetical protein